MFRYWKKKEMKKKREREEIESYSFIEIYRVRNYIDDVTIKFNFNQIFLVPEVNHKPFILERP